jgi:hypothetical protein
MDLCTDNGVVRATVVRSLSVCPYAIPRLEELKKESIPNSTIPPPPTETAMPVQLST